MSDDPFELGAFVTSTDPVHVLQRTDETTFESVCGAVSHECRWPHSAVRGVVEFRRYEDVVDVVCGNCSRSITDEVD